MHRQEEEVEAAGLTSELCLLSLPYPYLTRGYMTTPCQSFENKIHARFNPGPVQEHSGSSINFEVPYTSNFFPGIVSARLE